AQTCAETDRRPDVPAEYRASSWSPPRPCSQRRMLKILKKSLPAGSRVRYCYRCRFREDILKSGLAEGSWLPPGALNVFIDHAVFAPASVVGWILYGAWRSRCCAQANPFLSE